VVEKLVLEERGKFRSALGIQESSTVFFFAPGNLESEVLWTVPRFYAGW
jgi:hypothetical protein